MGEYRRKTFVFEITACKTQLTACVEVEYVYEDGLGFEESSAGRPLITSSRHSSTQQTFDPTSIHSHQEEITKPTEQTSEAALIQNPDTDQSFPAVKIDVVSDFNYANDDGWNKQETPFIRAQSGTKTLHVFRTSAEIPMENFIRTDHTDASRQALDLTDLVWPLKSLKEAKLLQHYTTYLAPWVSP